MHLDNIALVLEGGGMRGMFSAGVFEAFLARELTFPYITAVSAGACNILSYMSHQPLRTRQIIEHYVTDKRYFSLHNWIKKGSIFGFDISGYRQIIIIAGYFFIACQMCKMLHLFSLSKHIHNTVDILWCQLIVVSNLHTLTCGINK